MERYRDTLTILVVGLVLGAIFLVIVGLAENFKAGIAVGGTFWAAAAFLGATALPARS